MIQKKHILETTVIGSDDGQKTFEVARSWDISGKKAIIIELYPTVSIASADMMDLSTMHLLNHKNDIAVGSIRILNLYSMVQSTKPSASDLKEDIDNLAYVADVLDEDDISDYLIILAWGSSLVTHVPTINSKLQILNTIKEKNLSENTFQLFVDDLDTCCVSGVHPLYLGLHFNKSQWELAPYPIDAEIKSLTAATKPNKPKPLGKGAKKKNVLQDQEQV